MNRHTITLSIVLLMVAATLLIPQRTEAGGSNQGATLVHPNPFTEGTTFQLTMPKSARIRIAVYNVLGELMRVLYEGEHPQGEHDVYWDGIDTYGNPVPRGVYVCTLTADNEPVQYVKVIKALK